jgi:hypothetical protein
MNKGGRIVKSTAEDFTEQKGLLLFFFLSFPPQVPALYHGKKTDKARCDLKNGTHNPHSCMMKVESKG